MLPFARIPYHWSHAHAPPFVHCRTKIPKDIPFQAIAFKIHYVKYFCVCRSTCIIVIRIQNVKFLPAFVLVFFFIFCFRFIILNQMHTHSQNINKRPEIKRFRCFFSLVCVPWLQQKRRNSYRPNTRTVHTSFDQHFCLISDNNSHKRLFGIFHQSNIWIMLRTLDFTNTFFYDTNCENSWLRTFIVVLTRFSFFF